MFKVDRSCVDNYIALNQILLGYPIMGAYASNPQWAMSALKCSEEELEKLVSVSGVNGSTIAMTLRKEKKSESYIELVQVFLNYFRMPEYAFTSAGTIPVLPYTSVIEANIEDLNVLCSLMSSSFPSIQTIPASESQRIVDGVLYTKLVMADILRAFDEAIQILSGRKFIFPKGLLSATTKLISTANTDAVDYKTLMTIARGFKKAGLALSEFGRYFVTIPNLLLAKQGKHSVLLTNSYGNLRVLIPYYKTARAAPVAKFYDLNSERIESMGLNTIEKFERLYIQGSSLLLEDVE